MQNNLRTYTWFRYFLQVLFTATMYFLLAKLSLMLQFESSNATPVWPAAGFAFAMILVWGNRIAPGILFGAFAANFLIFINNQTVDYPMAALLSLVIGIGNTGEALMGNYLLRRILNGFDLQNFFDKVDHVIRFSITATIMCVVSCCVGATTVYMAGIIPHSQFFTVIMTWWLGDFTGILLFTSFILIWIQSFRKPGQFRTLNRRRQVEIIVVLLAVVAMGGIIFDNWLFPNSYLRWPYWIIPLLVWSALRFTKRELITAIAIFSCIAVWGTIHYRGPFAVLNLNEALLALQAFIAIMVITKLSLSASVSERIQTESMLRATGDALESRVKQRTIQLEEKNQFAETILNSSFDSIVVLNKDTRFLSINNIARSHLRLSGVEDVIGKTITELPLSILPTEIIEDVMKALGGETVHREKIGSPVTDQFFGIDYIPLKNKREVYAVMIVGHDITQRIKAENELVEQKALLEERNKDLQKTNEELSSFAYVASHDLQEPLRKIQIFSKRIMDAETDTLSENGKDYFNRMKSAAERMQQLIEDLLTYSRTSSLTRKFEKIHLKDIVNEIRENLKDEITASNAIIEADDLCECTVIPFQFRQLIHNLISNSLKFSKPGQPPHILMRSKVVEGAESDNPALDPGKEYCHIIMSDNGIGFSPEFNEQIFGLFQRLHGKHEYPGTGIGLSICKKIIDNHYGIITASGEFGKGATFDIYIPMKPPV